MAFATPHTVTLLSPDDFPAPLENVALHQSTEDGLIVRQTEGGTCRVVCSTASWPQFPGFVVCKSLKIGAPLWPPAIHIHTARYGQMPSSQIFSSASNSHSRNSSSGVAIGSYADT